MTVTSGSLNRRNHKLS